MKKIAWLLVAVLIVSVLPVNTGMGIVQAVDNILPNNTVITSEHIPDETLLEVIKNAAGKTWDASVTYEELQNITRLDCNVTTTEEMGLNPVKSLEGIKYLVELVSLDITGQDVTDLTPVGECGNLCTLRANDNKITTMPNLTNRTIMNACELNRNHLSEAVLRTSFPTSVGTLETTCRNQLPLEWTVTASSKYYEVKDKTEKSHYPFVIFVEDLRQARTYTVDAITVDGTNYTDKFKVKEEQNAQAPFDKTVTISADAGEFLTVSEAHHIEITVDAQYGESITIEKEFTLEPMQDDTVIDVKDTEYFSCTAVRQTGIQLVYKQFMTKTEGVTLQKVELTNQENEVYATIQRGIQSFPSYSYEDERYTDVAVRRKCASELEGLVGERNLYNVAVDFSEKMNISTYEDIEPGFYNLVFTFSDNTTWTYRNAYEAVTRPIIYEILDASASREDGDAGIMTDQTGDYVSIYVYGWNITKDAVKPVFYSGMQAISGDVEAVETGRWGSFFRIKKIRDIEGGTDFGNFYNLPVTETEGDVWDIPLSVDRWEAQERLGYRTYDVVIETEEEVFEKKAQIVRREIFSQCYDQRNKTYTVYFAQEADVDKQYKPTLTFQKWAYEGYSPFVTVENGTIEESTNPLTKQKEIKATFVLNDDQIQLIKDNSYDMFYGVTYKTKGGEEVDFLSSYFYENCLASVNVEDVPQRGRVEGISDTIFYLPYWIGGVYDIAANGTPSRYLTDVEAADLGAGKYAWASAYQGVSKENSSFLNRSGQYFFWKKGEPLTPPSGTPRVTVKKDGDNWKFSWNSVTGANSYAVYLKYGDSERLYRSVSDTYISFRSESFPILFQEFFEECRNNPDESNMGIFVKPMVEEAGDKAEGNASNMFTVSDIDSCKLANPNKHKSGTVTKDTKANASKKANGYNRTYCKECGKLLKTNKTYYYPKSVSVSTVTYNGKYQTPKVVVKDSKGKTISSSHYSVSKVKKVGRPTITITFKSSSKYYTGKLTAKCTVNPPKTSIKSLSAGSKKLTVKWSKKTSEVTGYEIQYSTSKSFKGAKTIKIKKNKTTSTTIKKLKGKKKYYVRIRTYKGSYKSSWSSAKYKTTKK